MAIANTFDAISSYAEKAEPKMNTPRRTPDTRRCDFISLLNDTDQYWVEVMGDRLFHDLNYYDLFTQMWLRLNNRRDTPSGAGEAFRKSELYQFMPNISQRTAIKYIQIAIDHGLLIERMILGICAPDELACRPISGDGSSCSWTIPSRCSRRSPWYRRNGPAHPRLKPSRPLAEPRVTPDELERLHDQQQHQAAQAAAHLKLPEHANISDLAGLSRQTRGEKGFGAVANEAGSWVDSLPLPLQLMTQPKLTVDMTLATLASDTPFGLSLASLCKLARNGFIYLNLRDYDSDLRYGLKGHIAHQAKLEQLLDAGGVYMGSAVRKGIFDAAISKQRERNDPYTSSSGGSGSGGGSNHYEVYRERGGAGAEAGRR